jgi:predicted Zn finger-like uncharacterized protein
VVAAVDGAHMMMQCPRCSTRWRVPAASPVANPLFKCGRCHHLFRQFPGATPPAEPAAPSKRAATAPESDTLEFIFPDRQPAEVLVRDEAPRVVAPPPPPPPPVATPDPVIVRTALDVDSVVAPPAEEVPDELPFVAPDADGHTLGLDDADTHTLGLEDTAVADDLVRDDEPDDAHEIGNDVLAEPAEGHDLRLDLYEPAAGHDLKLDLDELDETELATTDADEDDDDDDEDEDEQQPARPETRRVLRVEETMNAPTGFRTIVRAIGVAVSGFAALALVVRVAPEQTAAWLSRLPLAGAGFASDHNLATKVELKNVQGRFQRLRNARRVFVISGDARNNSPMTIERIEVAGALYGLGGGELDQKIVTTGNRTTLTDLSEAEIALLQRLDPAIALAPGETTPFLIVFLEPPRDLREFSSRVLSVRPTRRASTPPLHPGSPGSVG